MKNALVALAVGVFVGAVAILMLVCLPAGRRAAELRAEAKRLNTELEDASMEYRQAVSESGSRIVELESALKRERAAVERLSVRAIEAERRNTELVAILRRIAESSSGLTAVIESIRSEVRGGLREVEILSRLVGSGVQR